MQLHISLQVCATDTKLEMVQKKTDIRKTNQQKLEDIMSFLENNSTKIAGILCTATMLPVVGTVMAMEMAPGWTEDDKYVTEAGTLATGWQEIDGESYYFDESGSLDTEKTAKAYTSQTASLVNDNLKDAIRTTIEEEKNAEEETQTFAEELPVEEEQPAVAEAPVQAEVTEVPAEPEVVLQPEVIETPEVAETPAQPEAVETPAAPEVVETPEYTEPAQPVAPEVDQPQPEAPAVPEYTEPAQPETPVQPDYQEPVQPEVPSVPEYTEPVQPEAPVVPEPVQPETPAQGQYDQLNQNIVNAALGLVGVTNGWQCTEVATAALNNAGVAAGVVWPDQYVQYGYVTGEPQPGNLIYYDQGGRGLDHIAIYIGNGQAVHGNFDGQTIVSSAYLPAANSMTFIQIIG